jgi:Tfp pilus assembly protein PilF
MKKLSMVAAAMTLIVLMAACSKQVVRENNVIKGDVPTLEQQTVPPGAMRASAEFLETGKRKWRVGDNKHAVKNFRKSIEKNPYNFEAHYWLAVIERDHQRWEKSGIHFAKAVKYCPAGRWESRIRVDWGYLFELQGQMGMAAKQYDLALLADPEFREAQMARKRVLPVPTAQSGTGK